MPATVYDRLLHIEEAISQIQNMLAGKDITVLQSSRVTGAALERFIEIISEASRYLPQDMKTRHSSIAWVDVAAIGNRIRHGYEKLSDVRLWAIYKEDLGPLSEAIQIMKAEIGKT